MRILGTGSILEGRLRSNEDVLKETTLDWTPDQLFSRTGIRTRRFIPRDVPLASVAARAVGAALHDAGLRPTDLKRLIFTNSTGGDFLVPATANAVLHELGVADTCDCFDLNNACTGFLTALDIGARSVATGLSPTAVVAVEGLSRFLCPENPRPWLVMADAAGAAILGMPEGPGGILSFSMGNDGSHLQSVYLGHPGLTGRTEWMMYNASNHEIVETTMGALERCTKRALDGCGLSIGDIDWVVPHQPNGVMLKIMSERLCFDEGKVVPVVQDIGSPAAASMAVGLDALRRTNRVRPGHRLLFVGVGAGMSYGALIYEEGN
jgi:3-oxoacyl-(acyl-carrier-protein) synthase III